LKEIVILVSLLIFLVGCNPYNEIDLDLTSFGHEKTQLYLPLTATKSNRVPLFIALHGYSNTAQIFELYLGANKIFAENKFAFAVVEGRRDRDGNPFWNASSSCCNKDKVPQDDIGYLAKLIEIAVNQYPIDPKRVYLLGYSNGAFMAYTMACKRADLIDGMIAISGSASLDYLNCKPSKAVKIIHVHGEDDTVIPLNGGSWSNLAPFLSASELTNFWAATNKCKIRSQMSEMESATLFSSGDNQSRRYRSSNCVDNSFVDLQVQPNNGHVMFFNSGYLNSLVHEISVP